MDTYRHHNDDHCQHPDGCMKSLFTYCPHCHLYLCIVHLNQHHDTLKTDIHQTINEAETHRISLEQQIDKMKQQQTVLNDFYERELKNLNDAHQFVTNICENNYLLVADHERYVKQMQLIKQNQGNNSLMQSFILQIDQLLQQQEQPQYHIEETDEERSISIGSPVYPDSKDQVFLTTNISSLTNNAITTDVCSEPCTKEEEELIINSTMDGHSEDLSIDHLNISDSDTSFRSKSRTNRVFSSCPLSQINAFGFSIHHNVPHIPCTHPLKPKHLTYDRCYYHLISYHHLRQSIARLILKTISGDTQTNTDPTTLNIFSHRKSSEIVSRGTTLYIDQCPLTQKNVYGLQNHPNVVLCAPRPPLHLYHHLRSFHHLKSNYARRLVAAIIENKPLTEELFKPNEQVLNNSSRSQTRTKS